MHKISIHKVQGYIGITWNEIANTLANDGAHKDKATATPCIHVAHATPYWLASRPTTTHDEAIYNLHTFINKEQ